MKICIDAGHGLSTPGKRTTDGSMLEYEFNKVVADKLKNKLKNYDVEVYFSHDDSRDVPLQSRTDFANNKEVDLFLSIHANAYGTGWNSAEGIETYVYTTKPEISYQVAQHVQGSLIRSTGRKNRGVKTANFHVLRESKMPAVLIECGFMTNKSEAELLKTDEYRDKCATGMLNGLIEHYKLEKIESSSTDKLYRVQVGAFSNEEYAKRLKRDLISKGFDAYIK